VRFSRFYLDGRRAIPGPLGFSSNPNSARSIFEIDSRVFGPVFLEESENLIDWTVADEIVVEPGLQTAPSISGDGSGNRFFRLRKK
jgi:hypothetical protein